MFDSNRPPLSISSHTCLCSSSNSPFFHDTSYHHLNNLSWLLLRMIYGLHFRDTLSREFQLALKSLHLLNIIIVDIIIIIVVLFFIIIIIVVLFFIIIIINQLYKYDNINHFLPFIIYHS